MKATAMRSLAKVIFVCFLTVYGCRRGPSLGLEAAIGDRARRPNGTEIRMSRIASFPWDKLYVFGPHTDPDDIDKELGFVWSFARSVRIKDRDDICLLLFSDKGRIADYVVQARQEADFAALHRFGGYKRKDAVFIVSADAGWPWLVWRPAPAGKDKKDSQ